MLLASDNTTVNPTPIILRALNLSEGEQNRLIQSHSPLVKPIAAKYRGAKDIPFEDIMAEGMVGLVLAARTWTPPGRFSVYAAVSIRNSILSLINRWEKFVTVNDPDMSAREYWEWAIWSYCAPYEQWTTLAATPTELMQNFSDIVHDRMAISSAMIGLDRRDREIVYARFFRDPNQTLHSIAREHKISYSRVVFLLNRALNKIRDVLK